MITLILPLLLAVRVPTPTLSASGTYATPYTVIVRSRATGETVYCARDAQPKRSVSQRVALDAAGMASWTITESQTVNCRAWALDGRSPSEIASATYTITGTSPPPPTSGWATICAGGDPVGHPEYIEPTRTLVNNTPTVIYACNCAAGYADGNCQDSTANDANTGAANSKDTPIKSWSAIQTAWRALRAGDTLALCKGGAWIADTDQGFYTTWRNANCTAAQPCTFREYAPTWGTGAENRPRLVSTSNTNVFTIWGQFGTDTALLHGFRFLNLRLYRPDGGSTVASRTSTAFQIINSVSNGEICNVEISGYGMAFYPEGTRTGLTCDNTTWRIRGNRVVNSCNFVMYGNGADWEWNDNYFDNNGHGLCGSYPYNVIGSAETHQFYLSGGDASSAHAGCLISNYRLINNEFHRMQTFQGAMDTVMSYNTSLNQWVVTSGTWYDQPYSKGSALSIGSRNSTGVLWENNLIDWTPCHPSMGGQTFIGGNVDTPGGTLSNLTLRRNRIKHCRGKVATFDSVAQAVIEDNLITVAGPVDDIALLAVPSGTGISAPSTIIRNNTFYLTGGGSYPVIKTTGYNSTTGNIVTGNSITFAGTTGNICYQIDNPTLVSFMDNNQCSNATNFASTGGVGYSLPAWRTYTAGLGYGTSGQGFDQFSTTATPTFVGAPTNLTPAPNDAALRNKGSTRTGCMVQGVATTCSSMLAINWLDATTWSPGATAASRSDGAPDIGAIEAPQTATWAATCAAEAEPTSNVTYVCDCTDAAVAAGTCVRGNDTTGNGTKGSPYRSWEKARVVFTSLPAGGGTVALCKGGQWAAVAAGWHNSNCSTTGWCTLRDYAPATGATAAPRVVMSGDGALWLFQGGNPEHGYRFLNLNLVDGSAGTNSTTTAVRLLSSQIDGVEVCNNTFDGFSMAMAVEADTTPGAAASHVNVRGNRFINNCTDAIYGEFRNSDIDGNYFDNNGHSACGRYNLWCQQGGTTHTVYFSGRNGPLDNVRVINNEVHRNAMFNGGRVTGLCGQQAGDTVYGQSYPQGSPFTMAGAGSNVVYENNLIDMTPVHPIAPGGAIFGGANDASHPAWGFTNTVVRRNKILAGRGTQIGHTAQFNGLYEDNVIVVDAPEYAAFALPHDSEYPASTGVTVRNNTIYVTGAAAADYNAIRVSQSAANITGNSVTFAAGGGTCFRAASPASFMDNNQCGGSTYFARTSTTAYSYSAWRSAFPAMDANSTTALATFVNAPTDLTPAAGDTTLAGKASTASSCVVLGAVNQPCSSGVAIGSPTWNATAAAKIRDAAPDIGAMER